MRQALRLALLGLVLKGFAAVLLPQVQADEKCDEVNIQTVAENRLKEGKIARRGVGIFFAGATANALPDSEKMAVEAELGRFFQAFGSVFSPHAYFWNAQPELVRQKQVRFDYIVVVDAELNSGSLPKYDEYLSSYKGKRIDDEQIAIADYITPSGNQRSTPSYAFIQIADSGPCEAYVMFTQWLLLVLGTDLSLHAGKDYNARLLSFAAGDATAPSMVESLRRTHDMIVYGCLAPVFKQ